MALDYEKQTQGFICLLTEAQSESAYKDHNNIRCRHSQSLSYNLYVERNQVCIIYDPKGTLSPSRGGRREESVLQHIALQTELFPCLSHRLNYALYQPQ